MLTIYFTAKMRRDVKRMRRRGCDMAKLEAVLDALAACKALPPRFRDHALAEERSGFRECHIEPDWLLVYRVDGERFILVATETGTHADLFRK